MNSLIEVRDVVLAYPRGTKFGPMSLEIREGEALALVGESGAGKSTVALALMNVLRFKGGRKLEGEIVRHCSPKEIAYVPQDPAAALDPLFTIGNQIRELGCSENAIREVLEKVHLPLTNINLKSYPHELSGGMLQRLLIAMALVRRPKLLIADEPTSSLDVIHQAEIMKLFRAIRAEGIAILFITHHLPLAMDLCSRMAVMSRGQIVETGTPRAIYEGPRHEFTRRLLAAVPGLEFA